MWRIPPRLAPVITHIWVLPATIKGSILKADPRVGIYHDQQDMSILMRRSNLMVVRLDRQFGRLGASSVRFYLNVFPLPPTFFASAVAFHS